MPKRWEDLDLTEDFIFGKVMRNRKLCKKLLEVILGVRIERIEYPEEQKSIDIIRDAKSVRLDVYVADGMDTVYNVEMQTTNTKELPKRSRYYQGMIDLGLIEKGQSYNELKKSFVIFICTFDPFGKGRHLYTFENACKQDDSLTLRDETAKVFLNAAGTMDDVKPELKAFLDYISEKKVETDFVSLLNDEVQKVKHNTEWRREYMTLHMKYQEKLAEGLAKGRAEGFAEGIAKGRAERQPEIFAEGALDTLLSLAKKGLLNTQDAAKEAGLSVEEFLQRMSAYNV